MANTGVQNLGRHVDEETKIRTVWPNTRILSMEPRFVTILRLEFWGDS